MDAKKERYDFIAKCIRQFQAQGIINNYLMMKEDARPIYNQLKKDCPEKIGFSNFVQYMNQLKIIKKTNNNKKIFFDELLLDAIIKNEGHVIRKPSTTFIVSQSFAFRNSEIITGVPNTSKFDCKLCKRGFASLMALDQHKRDKGHIARDVRNFGNNSVNKDVVAEVVEGRGNSREIIVCNSGANLVELKIKNLSMETVQLEIGALNAFLTNIRTSFNVASLLPRNCIVMKLSVDCREARTYDYPLLFTVKKNEITSYFTKHLVFDSHSGEFSYLHAKKPYVRRKPIVKAADEVFLNGNRPRFDNLMNYEIHLQQYKLTYNMTAVFNGNLEKILPEPEAEALRLGILSLMDVPNKSNPLTVENYVDMLDLLLYMEEHQMKIDITNYDIERELEPVRGRSNCFELKGLELSEHRPSLIVGDVVRVKLADSTTVFKAYVHDKLESSVILHFHPSFAEKVFVAKHKFHVSFEFNRTTLRLEHQAVDLIREHEAAEYFFPKNLTPQRLENFSFKYYNNDIKSNVQQQQAVAHIVSRTAYPAPYLIFGPPGTGKTVTVVEAIEQVVKLLPGKKILVCTPSNNAANVIADRLCKRMKKSQLFRFISYSYPFLEIPTEVLPFCNYQNGRRDGYYAPTIEALQDYTVVVSTLTNAGKLYNAGLPANHFSYVFIDESGHATETETLIALAGIVTSEKNLNAQIVLAGDPEQLGPIIHSTIAKTYGFGTSMLERLMKTNETYQKHNNSYNNNYLTKLLNNYRSHEELLKIPNDKFYEGELISKGNNMVNVALGLEVLRNKKYPMLFHNVLGLDEREANSPSFFNVQEVKTVVDYLKQLIGSRMQGMLINEGHIGIITPYRKQVQKIRLECKRRNWSNIQIGSVEQFQGTERLIIIISTVRSKPEYVNHDQKFHLGFLKNPKRFNVALTRAKALVIVVGNGELLQFDELWRTYIETCQRNNNCKGSPLNLVDESVLRDQYANLLNNMQNMRIEDDIDFARGNQ